jgi:hypothetical protein
MMTHPGYIVRVVLNGSTIERYVAPGGVLTREYGEAQRLPRDAAFTVARHWQSCSKGASVDVLERYGEGRPVAEEDA